ncbi:MAG: glycosyltransferase [Microterricola sp.]
MPLIIAVVPTFNPDADVTVRLEALAAQCDAVIVVDDGSGDRAEPALAGIEAAGYVLLRHAGNRGIAAALNTGIAAALDRGADYVVNLDQDTLVPPGYVAACLAVFDGAARATRLGIVCADAINGSPSIPPRHSPEGFGLVGEAIQSGMVISAECLRVAGLMDERLFIDCVDTEFCLRVGESGFRIAVASGTNLQHALGAQVPFKPFGVQRMRDGRPALYQYHSPVRRYFITRNNIDLGLRYLRRQPRWVASAVRRESVPAVKHIVGGPHRLRHLLAAICGTAHGLIRRRGPLSPSLRRALTPR